MSNFDALRIKSNYDLFLKIQNEKRIKLLTFIYPQARKYKELIEYTGLKPASLYHHLNILYPLVEKIGRGSYQITSQGSQIIEELGHIPESNQKPLIKTPLKEIEVNGKQSNDYSKSMDGSSDIEGNLEGRTTTMQDPLALIWLGKTNYFVLSIIIFTVVTLGFKGVSLAGSAIYAPGKGMSFQFIIASLLLGSLVLYIVETTQQSFPEYRRIRYIITIRIFSMLPGVVFGIGLLLLFSSGITPPNTIYPFLFALSLALGVITSISGISYLRGQVYQKSVNMAIILGILDLCLGFVVIISI